MAFSNLRIFQERIPRQTTFENKTPSIRVLSEIRRITHAINTAYAFLQINRFMDNKRAFGYGTMLLLVRNE